MSWRDVQAELAADPRTAEAITELVQLHERHSQTVQEMTKVIREEVTKTEELKQIQLDVCAIVWDPWFNAVVAELTGKRDMKRAHQPITDLLRTHNREDLRDGVFAKAFSQAMIEFMRLPRTEEWDEALVEIRRVCECWERGRESW